MTLPPHSALDTLTDANRLKKSCPAFSSGCPYAHIEESNTITVSRGELTRCPAFKNGCPFSAKNEAEILSLMSQIPNDHPTLNPTEIPSCDDGVNLVHMLNNFMDRNQLESIFDKRSRGDQFKFKVPESVADSNEQYLDSPQLAFAMKEGTKVVHKAAETSAFTKRFLKGDINADEYGRYINSLYFIYKYMEELLDQYKEHPVVKLIYFPNELNREKALLNDLEYFYGEELAADLVNPELMTPAVEAYVQAMRDACDRNPTLLIAHSYSRYLGDLNGGQILAKRLKQHVLYLEEGDSAWDSVEGLNFYHFKRLGNQTEFKNFYRERLNAAHVDESTRDLIVKEAINAFELNIGLFDEIQHMSETGKLVPSSIQTKEPILVDLYSLDNSKIEESSFPNKNWVGIASATVAVMAIGASIYLRYYRHKI